MNNQTTPRRPSFNLDRTFCAGIRCNKTESCDRYHGKFKEYAEKYPEVVRDRQISVSDWSDHDGNCEIKKRKV